MMFQDQFPQVSVMQATCVGGSDALNRVCQHQLEELLCFFSRTERGPVLAFRSTLLVSVFIVPGDIPIPACGRLDLTWVPRLVHVAVPVFASLAGFTTSHLS